MSIYLHDIPLNEAQQRLQAALEQAGLWGMLGAEEIPLDEGALGRVLAEAAWAKISSPHYHAAAMDGFAVVAKDTDEALPNRPAVLLIGENCQYVDTGDALPAFANAVIPIENVEAIDAAGQMAADQRRPARIRIRAAVAPWSHVRPMGEDMVATQLVLPAGQVLRPVDLGALAASGHTYLRVARKPVVSVLPTGTELVRVGKVPQAGDIIEFNSMVLAGQINQWGGTAKRHPITPDDFELIAERAAEAAESSDLVLLNAGSSAGSEDFSARVVASLGEVLVHGVAVRPGHPVILGMIHGRDGKRTPVIGVPGYPVSAALTGEIFVEPLISRWVGKAPAEPEIITASLTRKINSPAGDDDYVRVVVGKVDERVLAAPLSRGAGVISSLVRADGIVVLPSGVQGKQAGEEVQVRLYRRRSEIERTILAIGSHDLTLDLAAQYLAARGRRFASANVGSQGGLIALRRREAHLAGSHLLDPETGIYNLAYIQQYLPDSEVQVIALVGREQGLMVARGNPQGIRGLEDLIRPGIRYVNRQRGAGTRVLFDYQLKLGGMDGEQIQGYEQEEYTHLGVAAAIASGRADAGMGIAAAAQALELDFIPLFYEQYDLILPRRHVESALLQPLLELLHERAFRKQVAGLPGYDVSRMGEIVAEIGNTNTFDKGM